LATFDLKHLTLSRRYTLKGLPVKGVACRGCMQVADRFPF
jgi:hypothetical protein